MRKDRKVSTTEGSQSRWNDTDYLKGIQYATSENLDARLSLHAKYSTAPTSWLEWLHAQIDWSNARMVLDVGCGTGNFWSAVTEPLPLELTLCDISPAMLARAQVAAISRVKSVRAIEASLEDLPLRDDFCDVVLANHMLYHVPDVARGVSELRRVLGAHGFLVASTIGPSHMRELKEIGNSVFGGRSAGAGDLFGPVSGRRYLEERFTQVEWRSYDDELVCTEPKDVVAYFMSVLPRERVTEEHVRRLFEEIARRSDAGGLRITKEAGVFLARGGSALTVH